MYPLMVRGLGYMKKLLEKKQWKDILILVILTGITFLRYTTYKELLWFVITFDILTGLVGVFAIIYSIYNCENSKLKKWLPLLYLTPVIFCHPGDALDVLIYLLIAVIFIERRNTFLTSYFTISTIMIVIIIASYFIGFIPSEDVYREDIFRYSLGFVHPNSIFRFFFGSLMALYLIDKHKAVFNIYAVAGTVSLYVLTNSRTGLICGMVFVVLANLAIVFRKLVDRMHFRFGFLMFTIFSLVCIVYFHDSAFVNSLFSGRPRLLYQHLMNAGMHLIYGNMEFEYCDNRIIYLMVRNGCFALLLVNIFYYLTFRKKNSVELKIIFIMSMVYGLTENFRSLGQTIVPLLCIWSIYDNYFKNKNELKSDQNIQKLTNSDKN